MVRQIHIAAICVLASLPSIQALAQVCSEGSQNCQMYDGSLERTISDRGVGWWYVAVADDFVPLGGTLTSLCVWGQYIDNDPDATQVDCSAEAAPDAFIVEIFQDEGGLLGQSLGSSIAQSERTPVNLARDTIGAGQIFQFELTLQTPLTGLATNGTAYWLVVTNNSESAARPHCHWHWSKVSTASSIGNRYALRNQIFGHAEDYAFCTNFPLVPGASGTVLRPCCTCDGMCALTTVAQCEASNGAWNAASSSCGQVPCVAGPPPNDECAGAIELIGGVDAINTTCATTGGPNPVMTELGPATVGKDLWFTYQSDFGCFLEFDFCFADFDSVIAVYHDSANPMVCPCPTEENLESFLVAMDENCSGGSAVGGGGTVFFDGYCDEEIFGCYTIRLGGFGETGGLGTISVICAVPDLAEVPPTPRKDANDPPKTRFLSLLFPLLDICDQPFDFPAALRVVLTSLHHVDPPYTGGPSVPFTSFEGQSRWLGPPAAYVESSSDPTPFVVSRLQCTSHYRDWSTLSVVHVTGSAIVPSSAYQVDTVMSNCEGLENSPCCQPGGACVSSPASFDTSRWGDVSALYNPPSSTLQPDISDVSALVDKFRNSPGALIKARGLLTGAPGNPFGEMDSAVFTVDFGFSHISACVDAFRGVPYPYTISLCP